MLPKRGIAQARIAGLSFVQKLTAVFHTLRVPVVVTLFAGFCLAIPEQTKEIYRAVAQDVLFNKSEWANWVRLSGPLTELGFAVLGLLAMGITIWWVARRLAARLGGGVPYAARAGLNAAPRVLLVVLFLCAAAGVLAARTPEPSDEVRRASLLAMRSIFKKSDPVLKVLQGNLFAYNHYLSVAAAAIALVGALLYLLPSAKQSSNGVPHPLYGNWGRFAVFGCITGIIALFIISPVDAPRHIGPLGIYSAFVVCLVVILGQLSYWSDVYRIPCIMIAGLFALAVSLLDANDNHTIYRTALPSVAEFDAKTNAPVLDAEFAHWYEARPDRPQYGPERRYPIYVVAAQGGGIYAAIHTASVLGSLQEQCPAFASHLFAISSVSGGSLGAAVFAGLLPHQKRPDPTASAECRVSAVPYRDSMIDLAERVLYKDMLSPLIGALLFPDMIQFFLPYPVPSFDRALRFEKAFEQVFKEALDEESAGQSSNFLAAPYREHWNPSASSPALLFNATEVGSGRRRLVAPFVFGGSDVEFLPIWDDSNASRGTAKLSGLPVSTAAILSARFPWITPAGSFYDHELDPKSGALERDSRGHPVLTKVRLVDGSYFENSGVATALDLIRSMEDAAHKHGFANQIQIHLIVLTRGGYPQQTFFGLGEPISPVQALLNTRTSRAYITIAQADRELGTVDLANAPTTVPRSSNMNKISLRDMDYSPPLGWRLSSITLLLILAQNGFPGECAAQPDPKQPKPRQYDADCLLEEVTHQLTTKH